MGTSVNFKPDTSNVKSTDYTSSSSTYSSKAKDDKDFGKVYDKYKDSKRTSQQDDDNSNNNDVHNNPVDKTADNSKTDKKVSGDDSDTSSKAVLDSKDVDTEITKADEDENTTLEDKLLELIKLMLQNNLEINYSGDTSKAPDSSTAAAIASGDKKAIETLIDSFKNNKSALDDMLKDMLKDGKLSADVKNIIQQYFNNKDSGKSAGNASDVLMSIADQIKSEGASGSTDAKALVSAIMKAMSQAGNTGNTGKTESSVDNFNEMMNRLKLTQTDSNLTAQDTASSKKDGSESNGDSKASNSQSDDDLLKSLIKDDSSEDSKSSKVNMFMNMLKTDSKNVQAAVKTEAPVTANKNTFVNDVVKSLKYMQTNNIKELTVKINPKELGEMTISVTMDAGKLKAEITAQNKDSYNLLMSNLADIKESASSGSVKFQDVSVNIYNGDTTFFKDGSQKENNQNNETSTSSTFRKIGDDDEAEDLTDELQQEGQINVLA